MFSKNPLSNINYKIDHKEIYLNTPLVNSFFPDITGRSEKETVAVWTGAVGFSKVCWIAPAPTTCLAYVFWSPAFTHYNIFTILFVNFTISLVFFRIITFHSHLSSFPKVNFDT